MAKGKVIKKREISPKNRCPDKVKSHQRLNMKKICKIGTNVRNLKIAILTGQGFKGIK